MKKAIILILGLALMLSFLISCETTCDHVWRSATCIKPETCSRCGETKGTALGHNYQAATCTSPAKCSRCYQTTGAALGHIGNCGTTCTRCGVKLEHYFKGNAKTGAIYCTKCSESVSERTIGSKPLNELAFEEKAYVNWYLNHYMTLTDNSGKYTYTITEVYNMAAKKFGYKSSDMETFWKSHAGYSAWETIYNSKR